MKVNDIVQFFEYGHLELLYFHLLLIFSLAFDVGIFD
jgi:hypothetical protein